MLVRFTKNSADASYDPFRGVYDTKYMENNGFTARYQHFGSNAHPLPRTTPSWTTVSISARSTSQGDFHYLPDDITEGHQWLFRENIDDIPSDAISGSSNVPSQLWVR